ncbi:hypothetical protein [Aquihabitans sp. McL0605]
MLATFATTIGRRLLIALAAALAAALARRFADRLLAPESTSA